MDTEPVLTTVAEHRYPRRKIVRGYNGRTLYINLKTRDIQSKPVTNLMKEKFIGGRGFNLLLLWKALPWHKTITWDDPSNELCIASGPLGGIPVFPGTSKSTVTAVSPLTGTPIDSNVGGYFGPYLKFAGWDALEIQGQSDREVVIFIDGDKGVVRIETASDLPSETHKIAAILTERYGGKNKGSISVVSAGPGAEYTRMGCLNVSWFDPAPGRGIIRFKQAGRGGTGTVLRNKRIKAIVVKYNGAITVEANDPADPEAVKQLGREYNAEVRKLDPQQNRMAVVGTAHLTEIMNENNLLPVDNFRFGKHPDAEKVSSTVFERMFHKGYDGCSKGCSLACAHLIKDFELKTGPLKGKRVNVDGPEYETIAGCTNMGCFDSEFVAELNFYCDYYGIDTISFTTSTAFAMECFELGLINEKATRGLKLQFGNKEAVLELLHQMARGKGFGVIVGQGIRWMKKFFEAKFKADPGIMQEIGMEVKGLEFSEYVTKESLAQQGGYGFALKTQHDEAWLIFEDMVRGNLPTFKDKAEALFWFPMWRTWFSLCGLCKILWNDVIPPKNKDSPEPAKIMIHVERYVKLFTAVTGIKVTLADIISMSETVYNFQRIFSLRMGQGTREYDMVPARAMGPVTKEEYEDQRKLYDEQLAKIGINPIDKTTEQKLMILKGHRQKQYLKLMRAVYIRRGWNQRGIPTLKKVKELGIQDIHGVLETIKQKNPI